MRNHHDLISKSATTRNALRCILVLVNQLHIGLEAIFSAGCVHSQNAADAHVWFCTASPVMAPAQAVSWCPWTNVHQV